MDAAWTAGTAAVGTMVVLAYQGWQIQESATVSAQAVVVGQAAAVEAEKQRLDIKGPRVRVSMNPPDWPPSGARRYVGSDPGQLPMDLVYRLPRSQDDQVCLWADGEVSNEGTQTVDIELQGVRLFIEVPGVPGETPGRSPWGEPATYRRALAPGESLRFRLQGQAAVTEWISNHNALEANRSRTGTPDDPAIPLAAGIDATIIADDGDDNGVIDTWTLVLTGQPLEPVPGEASSWRITRPGIPITVKAGRRRRRYWRSKDRDLELLVPGAP
jgi:hypothetical protein